MQTILYFGSAKGGDAIDAANNSQNATEVRIARNMGYFENLQIINSNILIDGSYGNCADARNNIHIDGTTILNDESESGQVTIKVTGLFVHIKAYSLPVVYPIQRVKAPNTIMSCQPQKWILLKVSLNNLAFKSLCVE